MILFDAAAFRVAYPEFANIQCFSDAQLNGWWTIATQFISVNGFAGQGLDATNQALAAGLMTAHIGKIFDLQQKGEDAALLKSATIGKASVTVEPPPAQSAFQWWLSLTGYGQTLFALLSAQAVGGMYFGGLPERLGYRRVGGGFGGSRCW